MRVADAVARILAREGVELLIGYPVNPLIEAAAAFGIRPVIVRQERTGIHMADALSRVTSGERLGVFTMQSGPGAENSFGGVAQAYADSVPILVLPAGHDRRDMGIAQNFRAVEAYRPITKWADELRVSETLPDTMRRAFAQARNGRPRPVLVEIPWDAYDDEVDPPDDYRPAVRARSAPDPAAIEAAVAILLEAERPLIYAGQGVHYARAWEGLRGLVELLGAPVTTSLQGKSAFPEDHPLSLGSGGRTVSRALDAFVADADVVLGIGCSFTPTGYGIRWPAGRRYIHATADAADLDQGVPAEVGIVGDAGLVLDALAACVGQRLPVPREDRANEVAGRIARLNDAWRSDWATKLRSDEVPLTPYRVISDLAASVDVAQTIITHDAGSPRDQLSPFWPATTPLSYIGWGKTTQLGYGLGLAMGAKLAHPDRLCVNVMGDAAFGFTGLDFETAVRERIPILTVVLNNFSMAIELEIMPISTERYRSTDIGGDCAAIARALGGHGERVTEPAEIVPAIRRAVAATEEGTPALLEFITSKELAMSLPGATNPD
ncbi:MAG TPA: thiamine pyrophosphate-requiring protein [Candidatus Limnocylindrales bacterium]|nr:thiamine pyrophosphate-requiring protein [Candidatus Limnocylindrales bacterium]